MGQQWKKLSNGRITLQVHPAGLLGDESSMLQKVRVGQLHALASSGIGLTEADRDVACLQIPLMISSFAELDHVRDRMAPLLEQKLAARGFVVLNWGDVGWVHFFTKRPARTLADLRKLRLFTSAGDSETERLYKELGFRVVAIPPTELLTSLTTGQIEAFDAPPLFAMLEQLFKSAPYMIDLPWAPLIGATLISKSAWESISPDMRPQLMVAARASGERMRGKVHELGSDAVAEMKKRGLTVLKLNQDELAAWRNEVDAAYPKLRGRMVSRELFDEVDRLHKEFTARSAR
jgi:TRAP-type C4-dicarboxylate transport system substrate-binding protein